MERNRAAYALATWFGCGIFPWGPGSIGSMAVVLPAAVLHRIIPINGRDIALFGIILFLPAVWASKLIAHQVEADDPGLIVVDEVVGQCITFTGASHLNWKSFAAAFVLFRAFDIAKPFPIRRLEKLHGGWGIVADDVLAGSFAALVLLILGWFNFY